MKKSLILIIIIILSASFCFAAAKKTAEKPLKEKHNTLQCVDCHGEANPKVSVKVTCDSCHGTAEDVAKLTASKYKEHYNPHEPLHYGTFALCENCHREHTPSRLECNNPYCHTEFKYDIP